MASTVTKTYDDAGYVLFFAGPAPVAEAECDIDGGPRCSDDCPCADINLKEEMRAIEAQDDGEYHDDHDAYLAEYELSGLSVDALHYLMTVMDDTDAFIAHRIAAATAVLDGIANFDDIKLRLRGL